MILVIAAQTFVGVIAYVHIRTFVNNSAAELTRRSPQPSSPHNASHKPQSAVINGNVDDHSNGHTANNTVSASSSSSTPSLLHVESGMRRLFAALILNCVVFALYVGGASRVLQTTLNDPTAASAAFDPPPVSYDYQKALGSDAALIGIYLGLGYTWTAKPPSSMTATVAPINPTAPNPLINNNNAFGVGGGGGIAALPVAAVAVDQSSVKPPHRNHLTSVGDAPSVLSNANPQQNFTDDGGGGETTLNARDMTSQPSVRLEAPHNTRIDVKSADVLECNR